MALSSASTTPSSPPRPSPSSTRPPHPPPTRAPRACTSPRPSSRASPSAASSSPSSSQAAHTCRSASAGTAAPGPAAPRHCRSAARRTSRRGRRSSRASRSSTTRSRTWIARRRWGRILLWCTKGRDRSLVSRRLCPRRGRCTHRRVSGRRLTTSRRLRRRHRRGPICHCSRRRISRICLETTGYTIPIPPDWPCRRPKCRLTTSSSFMVRGTRPARADGACVSRRDGTGRRVPRARRGRAAHLAPLFPLPISRRRSHRLRLPRNDEKLGACR